MWKTLLVIVFGFLPPLYSLWVLRKTHSRTRSRIRQAANYHPRVRQIPSIPPFPSDRYYLEGVGYLIGDVSCQFNARSGYIRCAVNPCGPCEGCRYYEKREYTPELGEKPG